MTQTHKPRIGITIGDLNGVGPEVVMKALADNRLHNIVTPVIYGSAKVISFYKKLLNIEEFNYTQVRNKGQFAPKSINVVNCWEDSFEITPGKASKQSGKASTINQFIAMNSLLKDTQNTCHNSSVLQITLCLW